MSEQSNQCTVHIIDDNTGHVYYCSEGIADHYLRNANMKARRIRIRPDQLELIAKNNAEISKERKHEV